MENENWWPSTEGGSSRGVKTGQESCNHILVVMCSVFYNELQLFFLGQIPKNLKSLMGQVLSKKFIYQVLFEWFPSCCHELWDPARSVGFPTLRFEMQPGMCGLVVICLNYHGIIQGWGALLGSPHSTHWVPTRSFCVREQQVWYSKSRRKINVVMVIYLKYQYWIQWILFWSLNSVLFPLAPVLHLSPWEGILHHPIPSVLLWVTGTGTQQGEFGLELSLGMSGALSEPFSCSWACHPRPPELEQSLAVPVDGLGLPALLCSPYLHPVLIQTNPHPAKTVPGESLGGLGELQGGMAIILLK